MQEMQETWVQSLVQEDPLQKEMVTYSSILAWEIPRTGKRGVQQSTGSQRVGHNLANEQQREISDIYQHTKGSVKNCCLTFITFRRFICFGLELEQD